MLAVSLDAARADHFGSYGYGRDTTPFIDSLTTEGAGFRGVNATTPFTLCSVHSILPGLSWLEHDVVTRGDILPDAFPTHAGLLQEAGYHIVNYLENPLVSRLTGLDRGFLEFYENWRLVEGALAPTRERMAGAIASFAPDRTVFCFVHLRPPLKSYTPDSER